MKRVKVISTTMGLCALLIVTMCFAMFAMPTARVSAAENWTGFFEGYSHDLSPEELFNRTNTFDIKRNVQDKPYIDDSEPWGIEYNMSVRNGRTVMPIPQITVLTHGLGGSAYNWSNDGARVFARCDESLFRKICENAKIYWARMHNDRRNFYLIDITEQTGQYDYRNDRVTQIDSTSRHIVIVFQAHNPLGSNDDVYCQFNFMLSRIIYDVARQNPGNALPKVNLIGHSRGGLTNLRFALDHPDLVDSLISIGTPYFGTNLGVLDQFFGVFMPGPGLNDIVCATRQRNYNRRWNDNYDRLYSHINKVAIGSYMSLDFIYDMLWYGAHPAAVLAAPIIHALGTAIAIGASDLGAIALTALFELLLPESVPTAIAQILINDIRVDPIRSILPRPWPPSAWIPRIRVSIYNDFPVPLGSQLAQSGLLTGASNYRGVTRRTRYFDQNDGTDFTKNAAGGEFPLPHTLVTRDNRVINMVLDGIRIERLYDTENISDTEIRITGINFSPVGEFVIPDELYDRTVTAIGNNAFANREELEGITRVYVPPSVRTIGQRAFLNSTAEDIGFGLDSQLQSIGYRAFMGSNLTSVIIPEGVVTIDGMAFAECRKLTEVAIPNSVMSVGPNAFQRLTAFPPLSVSWQYNPARTAQQLRISAFLTHVELDGVTQINDHAFMGATRLTQIEIPSSVTKIGSNAFLGMNSAIFSVTWNYNPRLAGVNEISRFVTTVNFSEVSSIPANAFRDFARLATLTNTEGIRYVGENAFYNTLWFGNHPDGIVYVGLVLYAYKGEMPAGTVINNIRWDTVMIAGGVFRNQTNLTGIVFSMSMTEIGDHAFSGSGLTGFLDLRNITHIGTNAFNNTQITEINLSGVVEIGTGAFGSNLGLWSVYIPSSVAFIGDRAFAGCRNLANATFSDNSHLRFIGDRAFANNALTTVIIPSTVTAIGFAAFDGNNLTWMQLPFIGNGIENGAGARPHLGFIFGAEHPGNNNYFVPQSLRALTVSEGATRIGAWAFEGLNRIETINLPGTVTVIEQSAFRLTSGLRNFVIPDRVMRIEYRTFSGTGLEFVSIPRNVDYIGDRAFDRAVNLSEVRFVGTPVTIGNHAFAGCRSLANITIPGATRSIGDGAFSATALQEATFLRSATQMGGITSLGTNMFAQTSLTAIFVPDFASVAAYGDAVGCVILRSLIRVATINGLEFMLFNGTYTVARGIPNADGAVVIPATHNGIPVTRIGAGAFANTGLRQITIPSSIIYVGEGAFAGNCPNLQVVWYYNPSVSIARMRNYVTEVVVPHGTQSLPVGAFSDTRRLRSACLPDTMTSISGWAFVNSGVRDIRIPDGVQSIGTMAFYDSGITKINIPASVNHIGDLAFFAAWSLTTIEVDAGSLHFYSRHGILYNFGKTEFVHIPNSLRGHVEIPYGITGIGSQAFRGSGITSIHIASSVTSIGGWAFELTNLNSVSFAEGSNLQVIATAAFVGTNLTTVTIPESVTHILSWAFSGTPLRDVFFEGDHSLIHIGEWVFPPTAIFG